DPVTTLGPPAARHTSTPGCEGAPELGGHSQNGGDYEPGPQVSGQTDAPALHWQQTDTGHVETNRYLPRPTPGKAERWRRNRNHVASMQTAAQAVSRDRHRRTTTQAHPCAHIERTLKVRDMAPATNPCTLILSEHREEADSHLSIARSCEVTKKTNAGI
ncbi:Hypothetical predicted protein, partial [Pelobates cultripes]